MPRARSAATSRRSVRSSTSNRAASCGPLANGWSCSASSSASTRSALAIEDRYCPDLPVASSGMAYEPRRIAFLGRQERVKHYGIALGYGEARPALVRAVRGPPAGAVPAGAPGFTIAHDAAAAALGIVYWWANGNEVHARYYFAPQDDPGALVPISDTAMASGGGAEGTNCERR